MSKIPVMKTDDESNQFLDSDAGRELISETFRAMLEAGRAKVAIPDGSPYGTAVARQEVIIGAAVKALAVIMCLGPENKESAAVLDRELVVELFPNVQKALAYEVQSFLAFSQEHAVPRPEGVTTH